MGKFSKDGFEMKLMWTRVIRSVQSLAEVENAIKCGWSFSRNEIHFNKDEWNAIAKLAPKNAIALLQPDVVSAPKVFPVRLAIQSLCFTSACVQTFDAETLNNYGIYGVVLKANWARKIGLYPTCYMTPNGRWRNVLKNCSTSIDAFVKSVRMLQPGEHKYESEWRLVYGNSTRLSAISFKTDDIERVYVGNHDDIERVNKCIRMRSPGLNLPIEIRHQPDLTEPDSVLDELWEA